MGDSLQIILVTAALLAGAIAIFFAFRLMKRFPLPFVNSYFYYLVFLYIFGAYSLVGSGILERLLLRMETPPGMIHSARMFMVFLGIPFLFLSKFMFLRSILEFLAKRLPLAIAIPYFGIAVLVFVAYGLFMVRMTRFGEGDYALLLAIQRGAYLLFILAIYLVSFSVTLAGVHRLQQFDRKFILVFNAWYLSYMVLSGGAFLLVPRYAILPFIYIFIFLSWHLVPILFLHIHLARYHGASSTVKPDFESSLDAFTSYYEISKREKEVIRLICKGLSNQQISESLYISLQTVKDHVHHIFIKTGVKNRIQLSNLIQNNLSTHERKKNGPQGKGPADTGSTGDRV